MPRPGPPSPVRRGFADELWSLIKPLLPPWPELAPGPRPVPDRLAHSAHVLADRAYSSRKIREYLRRRQIPHTIPEKRDQAGRRRGSASGRPPGFDREKYKAGHKVECRIGLLKQARGVATRYAKLAVRYEATIQLTLIRQAL